MAKSNEKKRDFFWLSYSDLMTSLFFVMLVLFVLVYTMQTKMIGELKVKEAELDQIHKIQRALKNIDPRYFTYDENNERYKMKVDITFDPEASEIPDIYDQDLIAAGRNLHSLMLNVSNKYKDVSYLIVIEGNTQRYLIPSYGWNYIEIPDNGYNLSYKRALALYEFWVENDIDINKIKNCEVIIAGSGYFSKSRFPMESAIKDSPLNRRFTIQITPKIGQIKRK